MEILYRSVVTSIGSLVEEMLDENMFVFFCEDAPQELKDICVCHEHAKRPRKNFKPGDSICVGDQKFEILVVGQVAMKTFREYGHFCVKIRKRDDLQDMMLGDVLVACEDRPKFTEGLSIQVVRPL
ncbi:PTS glucitol/sorbitol transporter subunit IIA [Eubacteriales bacterium OttesenSCG-928-N14]|nr:PTS glucitol/sorbitol transporter subunit IIA [Eubacteriales bacterium OttesenSCG-928-N14]